jgi:heterodisulfide reductase subunit A
MTSERKIGVFVCHCGGNISDYVDVEAVRRAAAEEPGVALAKTQMFACSDASQQEMISAIQTEGLDGLVIASCSPKLHLYTFRGMAQRAGLNPYRYVQVNLREQCSWSHRDDRAAATAKGIDLVRAGIARARLSESLQTLRVETRPGVLVVGAGIAGMRAALSLADLGLAVHVVEQSAETGGWTAQHGKIFPTERTGRALVEALRREISERESITIYTNAEVVERKGSIGDFTVTVRLSTGEPLTLEVGAIIAATGFAPYEPKAGEYGRGTPRVITLPELERLIARGGDALVIDGRRIHTLAYIYCVGSRQDPDAEPDAHTYCSRFCCTAAVHTAILASGIDPTLNQVHLYRDMRTYGKNELLFEEASRKGSVFLRFDGASPPVVSQDGDRLLVHVADLLDGGEEVEIPVDLVVLVTGMVPRENGALVQVLKLPIGTDGFFNEIHPKLRPVETVMDGLFIAGASQGPKTVAESVASSLAAASKAASLLLKGHVELEPFVARVDPARCNGCNACLSTCPYEALVASGAVVEVVAALCKGGGACVPSCPEGAIDVVGYTDEQIREAISALAKEAV